MSPRTRLIVGAVRYSATVQKLLTMPYHGTPRTGTPQGQCPIELQYVREYDLRFTKIIDRIARDKAKKKMAP